MASTSEQTPWTAWPVELPSAAERADLAEYRALTDPVFIAEMARDNRVRAYAALSDALGGKTKGVAALLMGGLTADFELYCSDTDKTEFRQEAFFRHLFQLNEPDCFAALILGEDGSRAGESLVFVPEVSPDSERWQGPARPLAYYTSTMLVDATAHTAALAETLRARGVTTLLLLKGTNTDSGSETKTTATFDGIDTFTVDLKTLHPVLTELRVHKAPKEVEHLRRAARMSAKAHVYVMRHIKPGMTELQCEALFKAYAAYFGAARHCAYTCICGTGPNGAILHYGHAGYPNSCLLRAGDMMVLDMGAEFSGYTTDLTRSYAVSGLFTADQRLIHDAVRAAQDAVYAKLRPGVSFPDLHRVAEAVVVERLAEIGVLTGGSLADYKAAHMASVFMPHGLGHLLGLNVHDVGGYPCGVERAAEPGVKWVRCGRALEAGMVVTVEPGIYFNEPWIARALTNPEQAKYLNAAALARFKGFGGVRLEDDILITEDGYENLSGRWPTSADEIEDVITTAQRTPADA